jgi:hypothetical protein
LSTSLEWISNASTIILSGMGRRTRSRTALNADLVVTVLGVAGFLGFLWVARMDDANASPYDVFAFAWFFTFCAIKACLPWLLSMRVAARRGSFRREAVSGRTDGALLKSSARGR